MCQLLKPCLLLTYEKPETFVLAERMKRAGTFNERGIVMLKKLIKSFLGKNRTADTAAATEEADHTEILQNTAISTTNANQNRADFQDPTAADEEPSPKIRRAATKGR